MIIDPADGSYIYKDMPLTPAIVGELATTLFAGRTVRRQEISDTAARYHADNGGAPSGAASTLLQTKKALNTLEKQGRVERRPGYGYWRFPPGHGLDELTVPKTARDGQELPHRIEVEREVGRGPQVVYIYSYPEYRRGAERDGRDSWRLKVGRSDKTNSRERVMDQCREAAPEWPVIHLAVYTDDARRLEDFLHWVLKGQGRQLDAPGSEWFDASPELVTSLIQQVLPHVFNNEP